MATGYQINFNAQTEWPSTLYFDSTIYSVILESGCAIVIERVDATEPTRWIAWWRVVEVQYPVEIPVDMTPVTSEPTIDQPGKSA